MQEVSLRFGRDDEPSNDPLIKCLEGELRFNSGTTYFKVRGMWFKITADHHSLLQPDFRTMLQKHLIDPQKSKALLPHAWMGNVLQGTVLRKEIQTLLNIHSGIQDFWKKLKATKVCYVEKTTVNQKKLLGEILKNKTIIKHKTTIEEKILQGDTIPTDTVLKQLLGKDHAEVMKELSLKTEVPFFDAAIFVRFLRLSTLRLRICVCRH